MTNLVKELRYDKMKMVTKTFPWETFFLSKLVERVESVQPEIFCQYSGLKMFNTEYFDKG